MIKKLVLALVFMALPCSSFAIALDTEQKKQVRELVRETLMENPEILVDVINELKKRETAQREKIQASLLQKNQDALFRNERDPFAGKADASISIVYFGDMNCRFCKKQDPILAELVKRRGLTIKS